MHGAADEAGQHGEEGDVEGAEPEGCVRRQRAIARDREGDRMAELRRRVDGVSRAAAVLCATSVLADLS